METTYPHTGWKEFVSGNPSCFEKVFKQYYPDLYGYGLKLCNRPELVKDSIQELFEKIWQNRDELSHINSPNVYLIVSLRRQLLKKLRRLREKKEKLEQEAENSFLPHFDIEEVIILDESRKQQRRALHQALNQLPHRQKEVVFLRFYNGMSYGEIEEILSINRQSVRNHVYRAMKTLRVILDDKITNVPILFY